MQYWFLRVFPKRWDVGCLLIEVLKSFNILNNISQKEKAVARLFFDLIYIKPI
jgi:hypothetical protein